MPDTHTNLHGLPALICAPDEPKLSTERDALDLIGEALSLGVRLVVVPVERLGEAFFRLSTRVAGEIIQKFVTYRLHLVILGDLAPYVGDSATWRAFIGESNRGQQVWFVASQAELERRLTGAAGD